ncbi:MAG: hypothetical protein GY716_16610 [bacterium]|nr:hypothetical protein [bacterium]
MLRKLGTGLCLLALFAVVGCNDSDSVLVPNSGEGAAEQFAESVIEPAFDAMNRFNLDDLLTPPVAAALGLPPAECTDFSEACTSGELELCFGLSEETYEFTDCMSDSVGGMLDGMITELESAVDFDIEIDHVHYDGAIELVYGKGCVTETMNGFTATRSSSTSSISGSLTYCEQNNQPSGEVTFVITGRVGSWTLEMDLDGSDVADVIVTNNTTQFIESCTIDLASDTASCNASI